MHPNIYLIMWQKEFTMSDANQKKLYIAGMGMITPVGHNVATTVAAIRASKSAYGISEYDTDEGEPIIMARVPDGVFEHLQCEFEEEGNTFNLRHERMIRMAIVAVRESVAKVNPNEAVPLILAMPTDHAQETGYTPFVPALAHNLKPWVSPSLTRRISTGRAVGIEAIHFAFQYLMDREEDYILVTGVDSCDDESFLQQYRDRLLSPGAADAFAPAEGACALLLTRHIELAEQKNGHVIALNPPFIAAEEGHLFSDIPYQGDGLDRAFKGVLASQPVKSIHAIYSSMNGENYWAKEYGVAYLRNKEKFTEKCKTEHPADCYGDLGAATGTALIITAAENLHKDKQAEKYLVYSSSDRELRGALVVEKIQVTSLHQGGN
jgi:3-oxoacyl-[acyl-carrier-protein] synthase I